MLISLSIFFSSLLLFIIKGFLTLDPDFGWHIRMGQLILSSGIPSTDPFSYTMAHFPFVDHSWLTDIYTSLIYSHLGLSVLAVIFGFIAIASLWFTFPQKVNPKFKYFLLILSVGTILPFSGIRPQVQSWLFLAILLKVIFDQRLWGKLRFWLPLFFILWANLHGSYAIGVVTLTVVIVVKSIRLRKVNLTNLLIVLASWLSTLINPYGIHLWGEVVSTLTSSNLKLNIAEWLPAFVSVNPPFIFQVCLSTMLIWKFKRKFLLEELIIYFVFLFEAVSSVRQIPLWTIVALPLTVKAGTFFYQEIQIIPQGLVRARRGLMWGLAGAVILLGIQGYFNFRDGLNETNYYPQKAVGYLQKNLPQENLFSGYNWGGYLIWKLPQKKLFIDGRMPSWRYSSCPPDESCNAMQDYLDIVQGKKDYRPFFAQYQIKTVLIAKPQKPTLFDRIAIFFQKTNFDLTDKLTKDGWKKIYEDQTAVIYDKSGIYRYNSW